MRRLFALIAGLALILPIVAACSSPPPPSTLPSAETPTIRAWADNITDATMKGLSDGDLARYTQFASDAFKKALTQDVFNKSVEQLTPSLGSYVSAEFSSIELKGDYIIVHYKAKYTKKDAVGLRMVFDQDHRVSGQWFE